MIRTPAELWRAFADRSHAGRGDDDLALVYGNERLSCCDLIERSLAVAASWSPHARRDGDMRVLILPKDPLETLVTVLAAWSLDSTAAVLRPYGSEFVPRAYVEALMPDLIVAGGEVLRGESGRRPTRSGEECLILATSGTTADPKLVAIPARSIELTTTVIARDLDLTAKDRVQVASPLTYFYGFVGGVLAALRNEATVFLYAPPFIPSVLQSDVRNCGITVVQGTPSFHRMGLEFWNGRPFDGVRIVTQGGEPCGPNLAARLVSAYPSARHVQVFGMTEVGRISHKVMTPDGDSSEIGPTLSHIEWKIVPLDGKSDYGRLAVRGPSVMLGYIRPLHGYGGLDEDGFFTSNDLVELGTQGLRFLGRYDRCFKSGGKYVNPATVESLLLSQREVKCALCTAKPHDILGQVPVVHLVFEKDAEADVERLRALCARELEPHMVPREIVDVPDLPRGGGGKILMRPIV
jgi:fatty acid CoA ligase FadD36